MNALNPELYYFEDDGIIPNSKYPLIIYRQVFMYKGEEGAEWLEKTFTENNWTNSWRWGVYPFHHYHSNTHEVLGVFSGKALLQLGGPRGEQLNINGGDIIIIPAGTAHKCLIHSKDFTVVGAYPGGIEPDLIREEDLRPLYIKDKIEKVKLPKTDPYTGTQGGLIKLWHS